LNLESVQQNADSSKFFPLTVNVPKDNNQLPEGQSIQYSQFLQITKQQITCAKEVHDLLLKFSKKVAGSWNCETFKKVPGDSCYC